ncbi:MAG TPA: hypothetical protein VMT24_17710 [Aggregatilineaceae bacterium]|jgi:hypothetical protein|nr:hypothetical protein [Aggregatilineaceae bacterium]
MFAPPLTLWILNGTFLSGAAVTCPGRHLHRNQDFHKGPAFDVIAEATRAKVYQVCEGMDKSDRAKRSVVKERRNHWKEPVISGCFETSQPRIEAFLAVRYHCWFFCVKPIDSSRAAYTDMLSGKREPFRPAFALLGRRKAFRDAVPVIAQ